MCGLAPRCSLCPVVPRCQFTSRFDFHLLFCFCSPCCIRHMRGHKSKHPATATFASSVHRADLPRKKRKKKDSAFSPSATSSFTVVSTFSLWTRRVRGLARATKAVLNQTHKLSHVDTHVQSLINALLTRPRLQWKQVG